MSFLKTYPAAAQDIPLQNPSIEGSPRAGNVPPPWIRAYKSPDTQPGYYGVTLPASEGRTYAGAIHGPTWQEGISQQLSVPLKAGVSYQLSFDLAFPARYDTLAMCAGSMAIYGSNSPTERGELLWQSGAFTHEQWQRYTVTLRPAATWSYIHFQPYLDGTCGYSRYTACLLDHISPVISVAPTVQLQVQLTCRGRSTGKVLAVASGGQPPYTYQWSYNKATTAGIDQLPEGDYTVTVTTATGASATVATHVNGYTLQVSTANKPPSCHGDQDGSITLTPINGVAPYLYKQEKDQVFQSSPVFSALRAGAYEFQVRDAAACENRTGSTLQEPDRLLIQQVFTKDISCSESIDGKIAVQLTGGTPPYAYSLEPGPWQPDSIFQHLESGNYRFRVKDVNSCSTTGSASIQRIGRQCAVYVPTAFTPNNDGRNDLFRAKVNDDVTGYRLAVYSRWGQLIFQTNSPERGWDGTFKGSPAAAGAYVWVLTYTDSRQQARKQTGSVVLLR